MQSDQYGLIHFMKKDRTNIIGYREAACGRKEYDCPDTTDDRDRVTCPACVAALNGARPIPYKETETEQPPDLTVSNILDPHCWVRALSACNALPDVLKHPVSKVTIEIDFNAKSPVLLTAEYLIISHEEKVKKLE